jgi:hypothetical protein
VSATEAEAYVVFFRTKMLPFFPFLHLPPELSAQRLGQDRHALLRCIIAMVSPVSELRLARLLDVKQMISQKVVVQCESSLDLLECVLVFAIW